VLASTITINTLQHCRHAILPPLFTQV